MQVNIMSWAEAKLKAVSDRGFSNALVGLTFFFIAKFPCANQSRKFDETEDSLSNSCVNQTH